MGKSNATMAAAAIENNAAQNNATAKVNNADAIYAIPCAKGVRNQYGDVLVSDAGKNIPHWVADENVETSIEKVSSAVISIERVIAVMHGVPGFTAWWEAAQSDAAADAVISAVGLIGKTALSDDKVVRKEQVALINAASKAASTKERYTKLLANIRFDILFVPVEDTEEYVGRDGYKHEATGTYRVITDFKVLVSKSFKDELAKFVANDAEEEFVAV